MFKRIRERRFKMRDDIRGTTIYLFKNYSLEFVTERHILKCVALWNSNHLIKRLEW